MKIEMKCFSDLSKKYDCDYRDSIQIEVDEGTTVRNAISIAGIPEKEVKVIFVNGRVSDISHKLNNNDRLSVAPATGGM
jgi:sulfur carrier protein ThiS